MQFNSNFKNIAQNYLFAEVADRAAKYSAANPDKKLLRLGIGDVTLPLAPAVIEALHKGVDEMADKATFKGYGPYEGYDFLRESIKGYYSRMGVELDLKEIFVSDGAKSDLGNILDIFSNANTVLVPDPVYPVYVDTNVMAGRKVIYADATKDNGFLPMPDYKVKADVIYICSPNNPTGAAYTKAQLKEWVDYANKLGAVILYDAAYESFITDETLARSIYQIEGAKTCAIEFCSFSKTAGFTGTRCGYTILPLDLKREGMSANALWFRRQATKFNGVPYIVQCGAAAVFTEVG
ncbi:MAG: LL-diaminopimelate aminotransferase, partial [Clostridia bacterium]|nr:LL-diaminopimelate aminotransferase [Clostridia bacterium]